MKFKNIYAIARKDWIEVRQNKYAWAPMLLVLIRDRRAVGHHPADDALKC
jgi:hypothetical protein